MLNKKIKITLTRTLGGHYIISKMVNAITVEVASCGRADLPVGSTLKAVEAHELNRRRDIEVTVTPTKAELLKLVA